MVDSAVSPSRILRRPPAAGDAGAPALEPSPPDRGQTALRLFMAACLYAIPVLATLQPDADYDIWWHLRTGQWVVQHGAVPDTDPFSGYGADKPWVAYSWLFEVLIYGLHRCFGLVGFVLFRAALALAITAALRRFVAKREPRFLVATGLTGLAVLGVAMLFKERPWLFTILFTVCTLDVVLDLRDGKRGVLFWLLPLIFVLWANTHIQFVYGLMLLGLACVAPLLDRYRGCDAEAAGAARAGTRDWWWLVGLSAACFLATLANPYHVQIYRVVVEYGTQPGPYRFINELKALEFRDAPDWVMLGLAGWAAYALGRRPRQSYFDMLLLAVTGFLAFRMRRDMWIVIVAALSVLATRPRPAVRDDERFVWSWRRGLIVCGAVAALTLVTALVRQISNANMEREAAKRFPVEAARVVAAERYPGPLYNDFNWGGYLIWGVPRLPVAIDGRTNLHGDERILRFGRVWAGSPAWRDDPDLAAANVVIAARDLPLCGLLGRDERFAEVHADEVAKVFVRKPPREP